MRKILSYLFVFFIVGLASAHAQQFDVSNTSVNGKTLTAILGTPTGAMQLPSGTTLQEPDTGNPGELRYNTTTGRFEFGVGGAWDNFVRTSGDTLTGTFTGGTFSGLTLSGNINGTPTWTGAQTFPGLTAAGSVTVSNNGILTLGNPRIYNAGQTATPGGIAATVDSTYGAFSPAAGESLIVNCPTCLPEVSGFTTPSAVATYGGRDSVGLFISNTTRPPYLTLASPTYDTTHIYPKTPLTSTQIAYLQGRIGAFIETNDVPKFTGTITAVAANGTSITVGGGWYQQGNTAAGQVPAGTSAYVDVVTSVWAINTNCNVSNSYPNVGGTACQENDVYNDYGSLTAPILTNPNSDTPQLLSYSAVCEGSAGCGAAFASGGSSWIRGFLANDIAPGGAAFISGQTSGNLLVAQQANTTAGFSTQILAQGIINLGKQGGSEPYTPSLNFYTSGNTTPDVTLAGNSGTATPDNGVLYVTDLVSRFLSGVQIYNQTAGQSGDVLGLGVLGPTPGSGAIMNVVSTAASAGLEIKSSGGGIIGLLGNTTGWDNPIINFVPTTLTTGQSNFFDVYAAVDPNAPSITVAGGSRSNIGMTLYQRGTGNLTLGDGVGDIILGNGNAILASATAGYLQVPFVTSAPTGTPVGTGGDRCVINITTQVLDCYMGTGWYHAPFVSGAG